MLDCDSYVRILETNFVQKMSTGLFKNIILQNVFTNPIYLIYMNKQDLTLNNQQWLICHKTQPNPIYLIYMYEEDLTLNNQQWVIKPNQTIYI